MIFIYFLFRLFEKIGLNYQSIKSYCLSYLIWSWPSICFGKLVKTLHKSWSFPSRISSVNVTISAENCGFSHIYWRNFWWKICFFVQWNSWKCCNSTELLVDKQYWIRLYLNIVLVGFWHFHVTWVIFQLFRNSKPVVFCDRF